ncbi:hypothetical protein HF324_32900 [Chitinophaga oryzae]|uniref:Uncharacterized protein n=1 Tax=Chitinophaga oryzae TaxID=2725414 RepID=A0AAE7DBA9_9BACT|nr:hypothetical protein [Chitinophaga oryzae]QJB35865.1 hypothetical protein HF329_32985 [Chitinophaga oryzae]QJB42390.1 hypothetical protein HF324_32900 [Chitinophaga oryzae]
MKKEFALAIDYGGNHDDIFDRYTSEIEQSRQLGKPVFGLREIMNKVDLIKMLLRRLSETKGTENENELIAGGVVIKKTLGLLKKWIILFLNRSKNSSIVYLFNYELDDIIGYIAAENIHSRSIAVIERDFSSFFLIQKIDFETIVNEWGDDRFSLMSNGIVDLSSQVVDKLVAELQPTLFSPSPMAVRTLRQSHPSMSAQIANIALKYESTNEGFMPDGENVEYVWSVDIWIDTRDAGIANKFMNLISSTLCYIPNVKMDILSAGVGSFFQNCILKMKGFFAKEKTKEIFTKAQKAAEGYALDRHFEPYEKMKAEREKTQEETKRMMSEEQTREYNELLLEAKREEVKAMKLANKKQEMEMDDMLVERLARGLVQIGTDFRVGANDRLAIQRENGRLTTGDMHEIDIRAERRQIDGGQDISRDA